MQFNRDSHALPSLLSILNSNKLGSILPDSVVNASTINLICKLLSSEDYVSIAGQLNQDSDVKNLLDFMLHLLRDNLLPDLDESMGLKRRARRLMLKIISRIPVIPSCLIVTGVCMSEKRDYIGSGGFGRVFKGELQGAVVALKVLYKSDSNVAFCREALMWRSLTHRFVLPFLGIYELEDGTAPQFFLVSPYMTNGNLGQWRKKANPSAAEVEERILEVAEGIEYIHSEGAVHGDLRGENILLDAKFHVQIADFGLTRLSEATNTQSGALHLHFAAPELFGFSEGENDSSEDVPARTQMSDVYAFGCLYYEIHYDSMPFAGKQDIQILTLVSRGILPPRLDEPPLSDRAWSVIQSCWMRQASKRPRMKDVMLSMTQSVSLPIEARDSFQELLELQTIPAQTLTALRQELGLDDRDPSQMTSAERHRLWAYHQQRKPDSPMAGLRSQNPVQFPQQRLKRSRSKPQEKQQKVKRSRSETQLPLQQGRKVAFCPRSAKSANGSAAMDENTWILGLVTRWIEKRRYEVQDAEPQEDGQPGLVYTTTLRAIIPLPDPTAPAGSPAHVSSYQEYPAGSTVMALYPDTTCFYPAEVTATPKDLQPSDRAPSSKHMPMYKLKFEDDDNQEHFVAAQWVAGNIMK